MHKPIRVYAISKRGLRSSVIHLLPRFIFLAIADYPQANSLSNILLLPISLSVAFQTLLAELRSSHIKSSHEVIGELQSTRAVFSLTFLI